MRFREQAPPAKASAQASHGGDNTSLLPNFCTGSSVLTVMLVAQFVVVIVSLILPAIGMHYWTRFFLLSLYIQWIALSGAMVLCQARHWLTRMPPWFVMVAAYSLLLGAVALMSNIAWWTLDWLGVNNRLSPGSRDHFVVASLGTAAIVNAMALRYFWVQDQWREEIRREADARYLALQARIRPHFLFNTLNSLAALIRRDPDVAEDIVADLSDLFRVSLERRQRVVPLHDEIDITQAYLNIELVRAEDRLTVDWQVAKAMESVPVPLLSLQPLVENAVNHGVMQLDAGGTVTIVAEPIELRSGVPGMELSVTNPIPPNPEPSAGTQLALGNLSERLRLVYGSLASLEAVTRADGTYRATVRVPVLPAEATAG